MNPKELAEKEKSIQRVLSKIKMVNTCWVWNASTTGKGYGCVFWKGKNRRAHRVVWEICMGEIPKGKLICHICTETLCVNPVHLYVGDHSTNQLDAVIAKTNIFARRTKCPNGHKYDSIDKRGYRFCNKCTRVSRRNRWRRRHGQNKAYRYP